VVKKVAAVKVRDNLGQLLDEVYYRADEVVIERAGKAILVPVGSGRIRGSLVPTPCPKDGFHGKAS
jgi:hypothetical protein